MLSTELTTHRLYARKMMQAFKTKAKNHMFKHKRNTSTTFSPRQQFIKNSVIPFHLINSTKLSAVLPIGGAVSYCLKFKDVDHVN